MFYKGVHYDRASILACMVICLPGLVTVSQSSSSSSAATGFLIFSSRLLRVVLSCTLLSLQSCDKTGQVTGHVRTKLIRQKMLCVHRPRPPFEEVVSSIVVGGSSAFLSLAGTGTGLSHVPVHAVIRIRLTLIGKMHKHELF